MTSAIREVIVELPVSETFFFIIIWKFLVAAFILINTLINLSFVIFLCIFDCCSSCHSVEILHL